MNKLAFLTAMAILSGGLMLAQSSQSSQNSASGADSSNTTTAPGQLQDGTTSTMPVPSQRPNGAARSTVPNTGAPSGTMVDQQPSSSTSTSPTTTMGTTGSTPGTTAQNPGNQSATTPNDSSQPDTTTPHASSSSPTSGSSNPNSSANGSSSNDMSGTTPPPHDSAPKGSNDPQDPHR